MPGIILSPLRPHVRHAHTVVQHTIYVKRPMELVVILLLLAIVIWWAVERQKQPDWRRW